MARWTLANLTPVVGNRDGHAVINWPGVVQAVCVLGLIMFCMSAVFNTLVGVSMITPFTALLDMQFLVVILGVSIRRGLRMPPEFLPRLTSHAA